MYNATIHLDTHHHVGPVDRRYPMPRGIDDQAGIAEFQVEDHARLVGDAADRGFQGNGRRHAPEDEAGQQAGDDDLEMPGQEHVPHPVRRTDQDLTVPECAPESGCQGGNSSHHETAPNVMSQKTSLSS